MNETYHKRARQYALAAAVTAGGLVVILAGIHSALPQTREPRAMVDLPKRIERLVRDTAAHPTDDGNFKDRWPVLHDWMNAFSLKSQCVHPDVPMVLALLSQPNFKQMGERTQQRHFASFDQFVRTLAGLEKNPDVCGVVTATTNGPFAADSHVSFGQTYRVGDAPIRVGGGVVVPNHFYFAAMELQATDPKADNFVSLRLSNPAARFSVETYPITGMFSSRLAATNPTPRIFFRLTEGELRRGDTLTVTYGDRSGGSKGLRLIHVSNSSVRFPLWILTEPDGLLLSPREATLPVVGRGAAGVHGFAPSIVKSGEPFSLSVRTEDRFRNLATGGAPAWQVLLNGRPYRRIEASHEAITVLKDIRLDNPGVYRFTFASASGDIVGDTNPVLVEEDPRERIYWGETHGHCGFSEGMGLVDDYFKFARDEARLDFVTLSEHDLWLDAGEWEQMRRASVAFDRPGEFITYVGYEWTVDPAFGGHHNVLFRDLHGVEPMTRHHHPTLPELYRGIRAAYEPADVLIIPHAHMTADATQNDRELEPLVEIISNHGAFEWLGRRYLASGFQLGFIGAGDDHVGHPGYKPRPQGDYYFDGRGGLAAVYAPAKRRDALFDAMKMRRTYATNGERIILKTTLNGSPMGVVVPSAPERIIEGVAYGTGPIESITLVKNGIDLRGLSYEEPVGANQAGDELVEIRFFSSSESAPLKPARAPRIWTGTITVAGAQIVSVSSPQAEAQNFLTEWARISPTDPQAIDFRLATRGEWRAVRLKLKGNIDSARLRISLPQSRTPLDVITSVPATGAPPALLIAHDDDPGTELRGAGSFDDEITVRRIQPSNQVDRPFRFVDRDASRDGDNYYVRVVQADGGMAWSSPAWVGMVRKQPAP